MRLGAFLAALVLLVCGAGPRSALAHESRPAYLQLDEVAAGRYELLWKTPVNLGHRLPVEPQLPANCRTLDGPHAQQLPGTRIERSSVDCGERGLDGRRIEFPGLQVTITDVLARLARRDGTTETLMAGSSRPWIDVAHRQGLGAVVGVYLEHGVKHILGGFDHLMFVFGLMLIVRRASMLLKTITAFTLAHSVTLALATLGYVQVPGPPVEAGIALSILLLAVEIERLQRGVPSVTARHPWLIAISFGLLHGFGFAGALSEVGLPPSDIPLALFSFNLGVEAGQLMFIAALYLALAALRLVGHRLPRWAPLVPPYALGALATFLILDRVSAFA
ncbi:MAG: HupE/UreJ family protein [Burkholderiales bacterium]|nr:HupE/UreJ family protein [Burkholderiales bacterium]